MTLNKVLCAGCATPCESPDAYWHSVEECAAKHIQFLRARVCVSCHRATHCPRNRNAACPVHSVNSPRKNCVECGEPVGAHPHGPSDGWDVDGRLMCHSCAAAELRGRAARL